MATITDTTTAAIELITRTVDAYGVATLRCECRNTDTATDVTRDTVTEGLTIRAVRRLIEHAAEDHDTPAIITAHVDIPVYRVARPSES